MSRPAPDRQPPLFTPVPVRPRRDGWTQRRQAVFIFELTKTGCVDEACRRVGLSQQSAYKLRAHPDAASFRAAWAKALAAPALPDDFTGRALGGIAKPITYAGRQVGERRRYDNRLAMWLVQRRSRHWRQDGSRAHVARVWPTSEEQYDTKPEAAPRRRPGPSIDAAGVEGCPSPPTARDWAPACAGEARRWKRPSSKPLPGTAHPPLCSRHDPSRAARRPRPPPCARASPGAHPRRAGAGRQGRHRRARRHRHALS